MAASLFAPYFRYTRRMLRPFSSVGLVVRDVALFLEDAGDFGLQLGGRNIQLLVTRTDRIANAGQKVCYWIGQTHRFSFIPRSSAAAETSGNG